MDTRAAKFYAFVKRINGDIALRDTIADEARRFIHRGKRVFPYSRLHDELDIERFDCDISGRNQMPHKRALRLMHACISTTSQLDTIHEATAVFIRIVNGCGARGGDTNTTVRRALCMFTDVRRWIRTQFGDIDRSKKLFKPLTEELKLVHLAANNTLTARRLKGPTMVNIDAFDEFIEFLKTSDEQIDKIILIIAASGCRACESRVSSFSTHIAGETDTFTTKSVMNDINTKLITQIGLSKRRSYETKPVNDFRTFPPIGITSEEFLFVVEGTREAVGKFKTKDLISIAVNKRLQNLQRIGSIGLLDLTCRKLRSIYVEVSHVRFANRNQSGALIEKRLWIQRVLGHKNEKTGAHYNQMKITQTDENDKQITRCGIVGLVARLINKHTTESDNMLICTIIIDRARQPRTILELLAALMVSSGLSPSTLIFGHIDSDAIIVGISTDEFNMYLNQLHDDITNRKNYAETYTKNKRLGSPDRLYDVLSNKKTNKSFNTRVVYRVLNHFFSYELDSPRIGVRKLFKPTFFTSIHAQIIKNL